MRDTRSGSGSNPANIGTSITTNFAANIAANIAADFAANMAPNITVAQNQLLSILATATPALSPPDEQPIPSTAASVSAAAAAPTTTTSKPPPRKRACENCHSKKLKCVHWVPSQDYLKTTYRPRKNRCHQNSAKMRHNALKNSNPNLPIIRLPNNYSPLIETNTLQNQSPASTGQLFSLQFLNQETLLENVENESPLLLNALYAIGAKYSKHSSIYQIGCMLSGSTLSDSEAKQVAAKYFYKEACEVVYTTTNAETASEISGLIVLHIYCAASENISGAFKFLFMAVGNHDELCKNTNSYDFEVIKEVLVPSVTKDSWLEHEQLRRLWWACYIVDRFFSASINKQTTIRDSACRFYFPSCNDKWVHDLQFFEEKRIQAINFLSRDGFNTPSDPDLFHHHIMLAKIVGRITEFHATKNCAAGEFAAGERELKHLDTALESWQKCVPANLEFSNLKYRIPSYSKMLCATKVTMLERANLQIHFKLCTILLHFPKLLNFVHKQEQQQQQQQQFLFAHSQSQQSLRDISEMRCFQSCYSAAREIKQLVTKNQNSAHFLPWQTAFAVFQSALIHLIAEKVLLGNVSTTFSAQAVTAHLRMLEIICCDWPGAAIFQKKLILAVDRGKSNNENEPIRWVGLQNGNQMIKYPPNVVNNFQTVVMPHEFPTNNGVMTANEFLTSNLQSSMQSLVQPNTLFSTIAYIHNNPASYFQMNKENIPNQLVGLQGYNTMLDDATEAGYIVDVGVNNLQAIGMPSNFVINDGTNLYNFFPDMASYYLSLGNFAFFSERPFVFSGFNQANSNMMDNNANPQLLGNIDTVNFDIEQLQCINANFLGLGTNNNSFNFEQIIPFGSREPIPSIPLLQNNTTVSLDNNGNGAENTSNMLNSDMSDSILYPDISFDWLT
ncbi:hypothetical protein HK100_002107 [Physocladia obscura]|uniref:Xylanolytic transcriptional activator regulatory domain-containing protein n=1 Tax=Physocladia obscura TaxID=109957 RepID=A0AAD5XK29_9FUNG|nr:hypothetical protein HK100_002107 [Physocladia obscura]